ncbi:muscle M-line assembly protein unc-89-like [Hylaeus volcanicus]|uniref:muscle M-line assembly protein unc-89-like n=1 Tax=Hylaeus volcanicus TaxID=313075 RepID=UPI0023B85228|nr:muscle M-line assembly protein unc-89-like [Hylaeus volcanicus]
MAVSTMWIKNNMLFSPGQSGRQLTEAELKVQRSLQRLSIPDWYLNKRSNPPKILNVTPIECRLPFWKSFESNKDSTMNSTLSNLSVSDNFSQTKSPKTSKTSNSSNIPRQQKSPEARHSKSPSKSSEQPFDTTIPEVYLPINVSKTLPKMSPSRKVQNINIVLPLGPPIEIPDDLETDISKARYNKFLLRKQQFEAIKRNYQESIKRYNESVRSYNDFTKSWNCGNSKRSGDDDSINNDTDSTKNNKSTQKTATNSSRNDSLFLPLEMTEQQNPVTPKPRCFRVRATSTPKFTPANLFSSTIIEESPKTKKAPCRSILEKSSIFERNCLSSSTEPPGDAAKSKTKKLSDSLLEKASIFESQLSSSSMDTSNKPDPPSQRLDKNISSTDSILLENDDSTLSERPSMVRDLVKRLEVSLNGLCSPEEISKSKSKLTWKTRRSLPETKSQEIKTPVAAQRRISLDSRNQSNVQPRNANVDFRSPCTRFLSSNQKSTALEKIVKSKQPSRDKSAVREIIEMLTEKLRESSSSRQNGPVEMNHRFVKKVVDILEKGGDLSVVEETSNERKPDVLESCSESDKSSVTSSSSKETDSSSDSDQRSSRTDRTFSYGTMETSKSMDEQKTRQQEDSVYWIPVSRCKLPRTSSLLSLTSKLSATGQSPCVSPIRSESEAGDRLAPWGATYGRTNALSRKLFRIDETIVIDSGYSDRSDKSTGGCSLTDSTWSAEDSCEEMRSTRAKRSSSRRKSIASHTFRVHA